MIKIGMLVKNVYDNVKGTVSRIQVIAGLETFFVLEEDGDEQAYYENELKEVK
jgi:hypothetical protein